MPPIAYLLFDLDGTLTDPKPGILASITYALHRLGWATTPTDNLDWCIGPPLRECFARLLHSSDSGILDQAIQWYRERYAITGKFENAVYPGIVEALMALRQRHYTMFVATFKPTVYARDILYHFGLLEYFEGVYGSMLDEQPCDKLDLIRYLLHRESLSPAQGMMLGDRWQDIVGAKHNGVYAGGVTYGYGTVEELTLAGADHLFSRPADVVCFLDGHPGP